MISDVDYFIHTNYNQHKNTNTQMPGYANILLFFVLLLLCYRYLLLTTFFSILLKSNSWTFITVNTITLDRSHGIFSIPIITNTHKKNIEISHLLNHIPLPIHPQKPFVPDCSPTPSERLFINLSFSLCPTLPTNSYFVASIWIESNTSTMWPTTSLLSYSSSNSTIFIARSMRQT